MTHTFTTNLRCGNCVSRVKPALDDEAGIANWTVDLGSAERTLTVQGLSVQRVKEIVASVGFVATEVSQSPSAAWDGRAADAPPESYYPLLLIVAYIVGVVAIVEWNAGTWSLMRAMTHFMAGFFLVFSFFKLLNLRAFADSYAMYDLVAARSRLYALAYPFIELSLGLAYLVHFQPMLTNAVTLAVMLVGTAGVVWSLLNKRKVKCACLGSTINLPMSTVTLIEDASMAVMAAWMLMS